MPQFQSSLQAGISNSYSESPILITKKLEGANPVPVIEETPTDVGRPRRDASSVDFDLLF